MALETDNKNRTPDLAGPIEGLAAGQSMPAEKKNLDHTTITSRFGQYQSGFWQLAIPMLSTRYLGRWVSNLLRFEDFSKDLGRLNFIKPLIKNFYGIIVGVVMAGVTGFYAKHTMNDMQRVFSEMLGWENGYDKAPANISLRDMQESKNAIINTTANNFVKYNINRLAFTSLPFFNFLIPGVLEWKNGKGGMSIYNSVDLGTGVTGAYLVKDWLSRKETFFEALQKFIDLKLNQQKNRVKEPVTADELVKIYEIHLRDNGMSNGQPTYFDVNSASAQNDKVLFGRMAELMNQTYGNTPDKEQANFTVPKLLYLLGMGLIKEEQPEQNLAYVEIANRYGMNAVKQMTQALAQGAKLEDVLQQFPVMMTSPVAKEVEKGSEPQNIRFNSGPPPSSQADSTINMQDKTDFAAQLGDTRNTRFNIGPPPASKVEKAAQKEPYTRAV